MPLIISLLFTITLACPTFRTLSGRCTTPTNRRWGAVNASYLSYLPNHSSVIPTGATLKSAREISNILATQRKQTPNAHGLSEMWPYFSQFLAHDLIETPLSTEPLPIAVPEDDPILEAKMPLLFARVKRAPTGKGANELAVNIVTSTADLSGVYGVDRGRHSALRERGSAKLRTSPGDLLPLNTLGLRNQPDNSPHFYLSGDTRVNEGPVSLALSTIFLREHNRLVDEIRAIAPRMSVQLVYKFARRVNIAQFQKIVYEEFYPAMVALPLPPYRGLRKRANPSISDVFAGAAGAIGVNMLGLVSRRMNAEGEFVQDISTVESFFRNATVHPLSSEDVDAFLRGAVYTIAQENDLQVQDPFRTLVTETPMGPFVQDLFASTIQRGRDLALPSFNGVRALLGLKRKEFEEISSDVEVVKRLKMAYDSVDDVEVFVGMVAEDKMGGVGETAARAWQREFARLRDGDRLFYRSIWLPRKLRRGLRKRLGELRSGTKIFRELVVRNSGIGREELPEDMFRGGTVRS